MVKNNTDGYVGDLIGENKTYTVKLTQEDWDHIESLTDNSPQGETIYIEMYNGTVSNQYLIFNFFNSNGDLISFDDSSSSTSDTSSDSGTTYVGSVNSNKFHDPSCSAAHRIKDSNLRTFNSRQEALDAGYEPCAKCNP